MPLMVLVRLPPRPSQNVFWCSFSLTRSGSSAFSSCQMERITSRAARTNASLVNTLPKPVTLSLVWTAIRVWTQSSGRSSLSQPPSGVEPRKPSDVIVRMFTGDKNIARRPGRRRAQREAAALRANDRTLGLTNPIQSSIFILTTSL